MVEINLDVPWGYEDYESPCRGGGHRFRYRNIRYMHIQYSICVYEYAALYRVFFTSADKNISMSV